MTPADATVEAASIPAARAADLGTALVAEADLGFLRETALQLLAQLAPGRFALLVRYLSSGYSARLWRALARVPFVVEALVAFAAFAEWRAASAAAPAPEPRAQLSAAPVQPQPANVVHFAPRPPVPEGPSRCVRECGTRVDEHGATCLACRSKEATP